MSHFIDSLINGGINLAIIAVLYVVILVVQRMRQRRAMRAFGGGKLTAREKLLEPNYGSEMKVIRTEMSLNVRFKLGQPCIIVGSVSPETNFRGADIQINAPRPGFVLLGAILTANINMMIGGLCDAFMFRGVTSALDMPTLTPANSFRVLGWYTGIVPEGMKAGEEFMLIVSVRGWASLTPGVAADVPIPKVEGFADGYVPVGMSAPEAPEASAVPSAGAVEAPAA